MGRGRSEFLSPVSQRRAEGCLFMQGKSKRRSQMEVLVKEAVTGASRAEEFCRNLPMRWQAPGSNGCQKLQSLKSAN